eukprot:g1816.t1
MIDQHLSIFLFFFLSVVSASSSVYLTVSLFSSTSDVVLTSLSSPATSAAASAAAVASLGFLFVVKRRRLQLLQKRREVLKLRREDQVFFEERGFAVSKGLLDDRICRRLTHFISKFENSDDCDLSRTRTKSKLRPRFSMATEGMWELWCKTRVLDEEFQAQDLLNVPEAHRTWVQHGTSDQYTLDERAPYVEGTILEEVEEIARRAFGDEIGSAPLHVVQLIKQNCGMKSKRGLHQDPFTNGGHVIVGITIGPCQREISMVMRDKSSRWIQSSGDGYVMSGKARYGEGRAMCKHAVRVLSKEDAEMEQKEAHLDQLALEERGSDSIKRKERCVSSSNSDSNLNMKKKKKKKKKKPPAKRLLKILALSKGCQLYDATENISSISNSKRRMLAQLQDSSGCRLVNGCINGGDSEADKVSGKNVTSENNNVRRRRERRSRTKSPKRMRNDTYIIENDTSVEDKQQRVITTRNNQKRIVNEKNNWFAKRAELNALPKSCWNCKYRKLNRKFCRTVLGHTSLPWDEVPSPLQRRKYEKEETRLEREEGHTENCYSYAIVLRFGNAIPFGNDLM